MLSRLLNEAALRTLLVCGYAELATLFTITGLAATAPRGAATGIIKVPNRADFILARTYVNRSVRSTITSNHHVEGGQRSTRTSSLTHPVNTDAHIPLSSASAVRIRDHCYSINL